MNADRSHAPLAHALLGLVLTLLASLLVLPIVALIFRVPPLALAARMTDRLVLDALRLSLVTSLASTALSVALGLPLAWLLATRRFPGRSLVRTLVELPMVLPPTVAGVGLLLAFGRSGLAGGALRAIGVELPFTTAAVVLAQSFVAAPFFITSAAAGMAEVEPRYLAVASTLRATPWTVFRRVLLPLAMPAIVAGAAMSWARALGEFGATITFAGNMPGVTQTMPLAVYLALQTDLEAAIALSVLLLVLSFGLLYTLRRLRGEDARAAS
ncbi:MAG: ABC transporter permease [Candidatus Eisenbacteria bacterium]